ncbi:MAG: glycosyltransferase family 4 protein [Deferrisomatales bacterium]|nr:glycosyltransferase family 4 protein [Deferrisomatales bacterium]
MRILFFTQQLAAFRSGVGTYARALTESLLARGHDVSVVAPEHEAVALDGGRIIPVPQPRRDPTPGGWFALGLSFARVLRREGAKHDVAFFADAREAWAAWKPPVPLAGAVHDAYALEWLGQGYPRALFADRLKRSAYYAFLRSVEGRTYRRLPRLAANSAHVARAMIAGYRLSPARVRVVPLGLPEGTPVPRIALEGRPALLFVGGNFQRKGLPVLLEALSALRAAHPEIHLHVVGRDRNQPAMASLARRLGVEAAVTFHGWQPNDRVRGMMAGADVFVMPSFTEGFGLVYAEAMASAAPVVATEAGGAREFFCEGEEALFVRPGDAMGLGRAIARVIQDPELANRLGEGGRRALSRLSVDAMAAGTELVLREAANG